MDQRRAGRDRDSRNLSSLYVIQVANALLPLVLFPHLLSVAGQVAYARIAVAEAVALGVLALALYSFEIDGVPRMVGLDLGRDRRFISEEFSTVLYARLLLFLVGAGVAVGAVALFAPGLTAPLALWLLFPLSYVLQSAWMLQGLETNFPLAISIVASRSAAILLVIWRVDGPEDILVVPSSVGGFALTGSLLLLLYLRIFRGVKLCRIPYARIRERLRQGRLIFFGNMSVFLYRDLNVLLLTAAGGTAIAVASYSLAEKLVKGLQVLARPMNQFFLPKAVRAIRGLQSDEKALRRLLSMTLPQALVLLAVVAVAAVVWMVAGPQMPVLRDLPDRARIGGLALIMAPAVVFGIFNFMAGSVGLNNLGRRRHLFASLLTVGTLNVGICLGLAAALGSTGAAMAFVASEALLAILIIAGYRKTPPAGAAEVSL